MPTSIVVAKSNVVAKRTNRCPVGAYARRVTTGKIRTGAAVRAACQRHLNDLKDGKIRGLKFDRRAARHIIDFYPHLCHTAGEWAGEPFHLLPWQEFVIGSLYGWLKWDQGRGLWLRRFRTGYVEVARKNGKSPLLAGAALYALVADGEDGAQVYAAATTREQAKIVFDDAVRMCAASPALRTRVTRRVNNLSFEATGSWFKPLSADATKMDGLNVHFAGIDELHEHPNATVVQKLNTAIGARRQPLILEITTAGFDRHSICYQHHEFSMKTLDGTLPVEITDRWFAYIATIDADDDWTDPEVWIKANPSIDVTVKKSDLATQVAEAREMPAQQNSIQRLRLNVWTEQATRWLPMSAWDDGGPQPRENIRDRLVELERRLEGRPCYAGLDLARVGDLSALVLLFRPDDHGLVGDLSDKWIAICRFWVPNEDITVRARRDRVPYNVWRDQGHLTATPGNTTDFSWIASEIIKLCGRFDVRQLGYDRTFAGELIQTLQDENVPVVPVGMGFLSMAAPSAEIERLVKARQFWHGAHPVLRWNARNVTVRQDPAGNIKPDKERSIERIDGITAIALGLNRAQLQESAFKSVYETRGLGGRSIVR